MGVLMSAKRSQLSKQAVDRWNKMWEAQTARMERQKESITRMGFMLTEAMAALHQIAAMEPVDNEEGDAYEAQKRAKEALDVIEAMRVREEAAAKDSDGED